MSHLSEPEHIGAKMHRISHYIHYRQNQLLEPYGITDRQARLLIFIMHSSDGVMYQEDIIKHFSRAKSSITNMLSTLEAKGLVTRTADRGDSRKNLITVTEEGKKLDDIMFSSILSIEDDICSVMSEDEISALKSILDRITDHLINKEEKFNEKMD